MFEQLTQGVALGYHLPGFQPFQAEKTFKSDGLTGIDIWFLEVEPNTVNHIPAAVTLTEFDSSRKPM